VIAGISDFAAMSDTLSVFRKVNNVAVVFLAKAKPDGWKTPTLMLRAMLESKQEVLIVATDAAKDTMDALDLRRVYNLDIPGSCVRANKMGEKNGIKGKVEIHLRYPPKVMVAPQAWAIRVPYSQTAFRDINQMDAPAHVDIVGRVHSVGQFSPGQGLPKREAQLQSEDEVVTVEFLGDNATTSFKKGDIIALKGAKLDEYKGKRTIVTAYLTVVEVNPTANPDIRTPPEVPQGSPVKKALLMKTGPPVSVGHVRDMMRQMEARAATQPWLDESTVVSKSTANDEEYRFSIVALVKTFDESIFEGQPPFHGPPGAFRMRLKGSLVEGDTEDHTDELPNVTFWSDAAREVTHLDGETVSGLWEACETPEGRTAFLTALNAHTSKTYTFNCTLKLWRKGAAGSGAEAQVNVNDAEIHAS